MAQLRGLTSEQKKHHEADVHCKRVREILKRYLNGMPVGDLAIMMRLPPQYLTRRFSGDTRWDVGTLTKVCDALGVSVEDRARMLIGGKRK